MYAAYGKRLLDIILSLAGILVLAPLVLVIGLAILFVDGRPILFMQKRIGEGGREFEFLKFRSLPTNTGDVPSDELERVHVSAVGRIIRRTNLDELPQLLCILKGDMSVVGPRPPIPAQEDLISLRLENGSLNCRPGLTGLAQINSYDGMPVNEKAKFDGEYADRCSLLVDLGIILSTFRYLSKTPPVY